VKAVAVAAAAVAAVALVPGGGSASTHGIDRAAVPHGNLRLGALITRPAADQRFPAVVLLHDCNGMWNKRRSGPSPRTRAWLGRLKQRGYVALALDSFGARHIRHACGRRGLGQSTRVRDAYAALRYLRSLPFVAPKRVAVVGWGGGGDAALASIAIPSKIAAPATGGFVAAIAFGPNCARTAGRPAVTARILSSRRNANCSRRFHPAVYRSRARADRVAIQTLGQSLAAANLDGGGTIFSPTSWIDAPLAPDAPLDPDQSAVSGLVSQVHKFGTWVNTTSWSTPLYVAGPDVPRVNVRVDGLHTRYSLADQVYLARDLSGVPIPAGATPAGPKETRTQSWVDHEMIVYQPSSDTAWELYHAVHRSTGWSATGGGKISHLSTSDGSFDRWPDGRPHGMTGTAIPMLGGLQRIEELQSGEIDHEIGVSIPHPRARVFRSPATRTDGGFTTSDAVPEGTRFRLPANLDIDALPLTPYAKIVAKAIQLHGLTVVDRDCTPQDSTCPAVTFKAEDPRPAPDPSHVNPYTAIFGGVGENHLFDNFPWDQLQVLLPQ
jgi:dienelactone hydrolase